ncbi:hypothetical protein SKAU_G00209240 [Synaphobranchus kaupii]|uniref:Uncharacterized protein n=1 Tax=Synaphobranchus kaupii TaxID=118154 RepID=A0A9Q1ITV6_SYNKA|nr:hypothetical protein SKAU_G00209240 [Synaphobranchus kaupii]
MSSSKTSSQQKHRNQNFRLDIFITLTIANIAILTSSTVENLETFIDDYFYSPCMMEDEPSKKQLRRDWSTETDDGITTIEAVSSLLEIRPTTVVSSANLMTVLEFCVATRSWVYREYRRGMRTHPWGAPVLRVSGVEVVVPILTIWRRPNRKSKIQLHREVFRPRALSLVSSLEGTMC